MLRSLVRKDHESPATRKNQKGKSSSDWSIDLLSSFSFLALCGTSIAVMCSSSERSPRGDATTRHPLLGSAPSMAPLPSHTSVAFSPFNLFSLFSPSISSPLPGKSTRLHPLLLPLPLSFPLLNLSNFPKADWSFWIMLEWMLYAVKLPLLTR